MIQKIFKSKEQKERGVGLVEIIVALSIIFFSLAALAGLANFIMKINAQLKSAAIANYLASEALEATLAIKQGSWNDLATFADGVIYHPEKTGDPLVWSLATGSETLNGFTRQIIILPVYRDANDDIIQSGGVLDSGTRQITATVNWIINGQSQTISLNEYLTNWQP